MLLLIFISFLLQMPGFFKKKNFSFHFYWFLPMFTLFSLFIFYYNLPLTIETAIQVKSKSSHFLSTNNDKAYLQSRKVNRKASFNGTKREKQINLSPDSDRVSNVCCF